MVARLSLSSAVGAATGWREPSALAAGRGTPPPPVPDVTAVDAVSDQTVFV